MKVLYLWLTMGPYHISRMNAIAEVLGSENVEVIEICSMDDHNWDMSRYQKKFKYTCCLPGEFLQKNSIKKTIKKLKKLLHDSKADIIINGCGYFDYTLFFILKKTAQTKKLLLWSESTLIDNPNPWYKITIKKWLTHIYHGAIVAGVNHSNYLKKLNFSHNQIKVVGNVVDSTFFSKNEHSTKRSNFLFVGRLLAIKNVKTLIQAFEMIKKSGSSWNLSIVGDGPELFSLKQLVKSKNLTASVQFLGILQPEELKQVYWSHATFVLPSYSEPWGLVVNEAVASGIPVIVSKNCGASEMITHEHSGLLFNPFDVDELATYMKLLESNETFRNELSTNALGKLDSYSPGSYAKKSVDFFKEIVTR